jgi:hypothetical protein
MLYTCQKNLNKYHKQKAGTINIVAGFFNPGIPS